MGAMVSMLPGSVKSLDNKYARAVKTNRALAPGHFSVVSAPFECGDNCRQSEHPASRCRECAQNLGNPSDQAVGALTRGAGGPVQAYGHYLPHAHRLLGETSKVSDLPGRLITTAHLTDLRGDLQDCHNDLQNMFCQAAAMRRRGHD
jgi:hypothetical protein